METENSNFDGGVPREWADSLLEQMKEKYGDRGVYLDRINEKVMRLEMEVDTEFYQKGSMTKDIYAKVEAISVLARELDRHGYMESDMDSCEHDVDIVREHGGTESGETVAKCYRCGREFNHVWY